MKFPVRSATAAAMLLSANLASAGLVTGDAVTLTFHPSEAASGGVVGAGNDFSFGNFGFDLNEGPDGDIFHFRSVPQSGAFAGNPSFTVSGLLFEGGAPLLGFEVLEVNLSGFSFSTTATSITFSYTDDYAPIGTVIRGRYITTATAVPEPTSILLLGIGLALFAVCRRRLFR